jgi:hypothetical protein
VELRGEPPSVVAGRPGLVVLFEFFGRRRDLADAPEFVADGDKGVRFLDERTGLVRAA